MRHGWLWFVAALVFCAARCASCAEESPHNRAEAVKIIADMQRIVAPDGIDLHEKVRIGGIDQWVSIRGNDRHNPVLLMIHGGPGWVSMPTSWYFQRGWEEYFTVVQWDQRGAGSTYAANDPAVVAPTMTSERMIGDAEEMVAWLRKEFGQKKIFVLGHSWGSYLGLEVAQRHPDWLYAYIGIGQMVDMPKSEREGWAFAMQEARKAQNAKAIQELQSIAPYGQGTDPVPLASVMLQRKWLNQFGGRVDRRTGGEPGDASGLEFADVVRPEQAHDRRYDRRAGLDQGGALRFEIGRDAVAGVRRHLGPPGGEELADPCFVLRVAYGRRVGNPQVQLERAVARSADLSDPFTDVLRLHQERAAGAESARIGHRDG